MSIEKGRNLSGSFYSSREHHDYHVRCDGDADNCEGAVDYEDEKFRDMITKLKDAGWQIYKDNRTGEFKHRCPVCKEAKKDDAFRSFRDFYNVGD